jgi:sterol 3beta-glucosyltransferase
VGVGPDPIPISKISVARLTRAIDLATHSPRMREQAEHLSRQIRAENGVEKAVQIIGSLMGSKVTGSTAGIPRDVS